jgi:hypothetical protein
MYRVRAVLLFAIALLAMPAAFAQDDPPARVGRISLLQGDVTFRNTATGETEPAALNWPITNQAALATGPRARAEIRIGSSTVRIDESSEIEFAALDDQRTHIHLLQGTASVRVKARDNVAGFEVATPESRIVLQEVGRYRIDTGRVADTTTVAVHQGSVQVERRDGAFVVSSGQRAEVTPQGAVAFRVAEARRDEFDDWGLARDRREDAVRSTRYVSPEMTGYEDLDEYGDWREVPEYGPVWTPRAVAADWAPYRAGHWAWVDPWGWTWVDQAPWGFAPFHYGRWVVIGGSWAWAPGVVVARPVYAPALVAWVGRPGWTVSSVHAVGWFPLGPREVFYPGYHCSLAHVHRVNVTHVTNVTTVVRSTNVDVKNVNYMHRHTARAVTVAPAEVVANKRPVAPSAIQVRDRRELDSVPVSTRITDPNVTPRRQHTTVDRRDSRPVFDGRGPQRTQDDQRRSFAGDRDDKRQAPSGDARQQGDRRALDADRRTTESDRRTKEGDPRTQERDRRAQEANPRTQEGDRRVQPSQPQGSPQQRLGPGKEPQIERRDRRIEQGERRIERREPRAETPAPQIDRSPQQRLEQARPRPSPEQNAPPAARAPEPQRPAPSLERRIEPRSAPQPPQPQQFQQQQVQPRPAPPQHPQPQQIQPRPAPPQHAQPQPVQPRQVQPPPRVEPPQISRPPTPPPQQAQPQIQQRPPPAPAPEPRRQQSDRRAESRDRK